MNQLNKALANVKDLSFVIEDEQTYIAQLQEAKARIRKDQVAEAISILKVCYEYGHQESVLFSMAELTESIGDLDGAIELFRRLVELNFDKYAYSLLKLLVTNGQYDEFKLLVKEVEGIDEKADYTNLFSIMHLQFDELELAMEFANKTLSLDPNYASAYVNKANILRIMGEYEQALNNYQIAESMGHKTLNFYNNMGVNYEALNDPVNALVYYAKAMEMHGSPKDKVSVASNTAYAAMSLGMFEKAWEMYHLRKLVGGKIETEYQPWEGEDLRGKTILFRREQGLGDEFRFVAGIYEIAVEAKAVILQCDPRLVTLFSRSMPQNVTVLPSVGGSVNLKELEIDVAAYTGDIAVYRRKGLEDFPLHKGYLVADQKKTAKWADYLAQLPGKLKVGISWRSGNLKGYRKNCYAEITAWAPLLKTSNVQFINLFYGDAEEDLAWVKEELGVDIHTPKGLDLRDDQDELAALISALDLVIGPNTAPVDLAMSMVGVPVWITTFHSTEKRCTHYFGEHYFPWAPHAKPIWGEGFEGNLLVAAREMAYVMSTPEPKQTINLMYDVPESCFKE